MTCIVGLVHQGCVWMGGDAAATHEFDFQTRVEPKVFLLGSDPQLLIGYTTSFRMGQLLQYSLHVPRWSDPELTAHGWLCTSFVEAVRNCFRVGGYGCKAETQDETGGTFLVGFSGKLWRIEDDYDVGQSRDGYDAVGCGASYALGSLASTERLAPQRRLRLALETAERFTSGVRAPFTIERLAS